ILFANTTATQSLLHKTFQNRGVDPIDAEFAQMSAPEFDCVFFFFLCARPLGARGCHFEIFGGKHIKSWFATSLWERVLLVVFAQRDQRGFSGREAADRRVIVIE